MSGCGHHDHEDDWFDDLLIYDELYGKDSRERKKKKHSLFGAATVKKRKKDKEEKSRGKKSSEEKVGTGGRKYAGTRSSSCSGCLGGVLLLITMIGALLSLLIR